MGVIFLPGLEMLESRLICLNLLPIMIIKSWFYLIDNNYKNDAPAGVSLIFKTTFWWKSIIWIIWHQNLSDHLGCLMSGQTEPPQMMQQDAIEMQHMAVGGLEFLNVYTRVVGSWNTNTYIVIRLSHHWSLSRQNVKHRGWMEMRSCSKGFPQWQWLERLIFSRKGFWCGWTK